MSYGRFTLTAGDGVPINVHHWVPEADVPVKGVIQIAHGMAEWAYRYDYFAEELNRAGYIVYANDHRGHGLTAPSLEDIGYISDGDGFSDMVEDMYSLNGHIRKENPNLPVILFGHSMGSFLSQRFIQLYGDEIQGLILSGSNGKQKPEVNLGIAIAGTEIKTKGRRNISHRMDKLSFGSYNKAFAPNRTNFDWLSRDHKEVDKYIDDPYCGGVFTSSFYYDFMRGLKLITKKKSLRSVPKDLPILIISGEMDPVGYHGKGVRNLVKMYKDLGIVNLSYRLYPGGRHEMLNETNKDEVIGDILYWLGGLLGDR